MNTGAAVPPDSEALHALSGLATELASTFVALSSDIALVIDADGAVRSVVQGATPVAPSAREWIGRPWAETVTSDTRKKIEQLLSDVQATGRGRQREVNLPANEGASIPVAYAAIRLGEGGPVLAVGRDLRAIAAIQQRYTESQQEMERDYWKRRQTESRYRMLFQVATDAVLVVDALTMGIVEANRAAGQLFGLALEQLVGKHATVGLDRHSWPAVEDLLNTARTTGRAAEVRVHLATGSGAVDVSATPFRSDSDLLLLVRARTPVRRARSTDAGSPAQWADLVRRLPDAVVITDSHGRVLMANPAFGDLCQLPADTQPDGRDLSHWLGHDSTAALLLQAKLHGIASAASATLQGEHGRSSVSVSATLLDEGDQECVGFAIRRLPQVDAAALPAVEEVALAIDALAAMMGRQPLPDLLRAATALAERHLIKTALQRAGHDMQAAALLLGVTADELARRLSAHALSVGEGGDGLDSSQLN